MRPRFFVGLDLAQMVDYTAVALVERVETAREWDAVGFTWKKQTGLRVRYLERLARASQGYVGSEIEQAIVDAMYIGFNADRRPFTTDDVAAALKKQVPLSVSSRETIDMLRDWLREGRAQSASFQEVNEAEEQFVPVGPDTKK